MLIQPYFGFIDDAVLFTIDADWLSWHWEDQCQENNNRDKSKDGKNFLLED